jgi:protein PhnA
MSIEDSLNTRSASKCELCAAADQLGVFEVPASSSAGVECHVLLCATCSEQAANPDRMDANHWRCLNDSMWSEVPAVQVMAWRLLQRLNTESWARDLSDMLYLDEELLAWAEAGADEGGSDEEQLRHIDSNGSLLEAGDTVVLIKDLVVKGGGFTAKRGTAVRGIALVPDNAGHIEGRVNGQKIVILTQFVKKS